MTNIELAMAIDDQREIWFAPVCETWVRRYAPDEWFRRTLGAGKVTVMEFRAALGAQIYAEERRTAQERTP